MARCCGHCIIGPGLAFGCRTVTDVAITLTTNLPVSGKATHQGVTAPRFLHGQTVLDKDVGCIGTVVASVRETDSVGGAQIFNFVARST